MTRIEMFQRITEYYKLHRNIHVARYFGISEQLAKNWKQNGFPESAVFDLYVKCPALSPEWLLSLGEVGPMIRTESTTIGSNNNGSNNLGNTNSGNTNNGEHAVQNIGSIVTGNSDELKKALDSLQREQDAHARTQESLKMEQEAHSRTQDSLARTQGMLEKLLDRQHQ